MKDIRFLAVEGVIGPLKASLAWARPAWRASWLD